MGYVKIADQTNEIVMKTLQRDSVSCIQIVLVSFAVISLVCSTLWFAQRHTMIKAYENGANTVAATLSVELSPSSAQFYTKVNECVRNNTVLYAHGFAHLTASRQSNWEEGQKSYKECYNQQIEWAQSTVLLPLL